MLVAVLFAPGAGRAVSFPGLGAALSRRFAGHRVIACEGPLGADFLPGARPCASGADAATGYVGMVDAAACALGAEGPDLFVCVGGDGLAAYAAGALRAQAGGRAPSFPLLGVAAGTINVGPIVSIGAGEIASLDLESLVSRPVGALQVLSGGRHLAWGFNDVVLASTFLGTMDGVAVNLSARAMAERGERIRAEPEHGIAAQGFGVRKNGRPIPSTLPAQVVASPLRRGEFYARAVAGILCEAGWSEGLAALSLHDTLLVRAGDFEGGRTTFAHAEQLLFERGDVVEIAGLSPIAYAVADGNPHAIADGAVELRYEPEAVLVATAPGARAGGQPCT